MVLKIPSSKIDRLPLPDFSVVATFSNNDKPGEVPLKYFKDDDAAEETANE